MKKHVVKFHFRPGKNVVGTALSAAIMVLALCVHPFAQNSQPQLSLEHCLKTAREQNPELLAAKHRAQAAKQQTSAAATLPDPVVSYSYYIEPVQTRTGNQRNKAALAQKIPFPGKLSLKRTISQNNAQAEIFTYKAMQAKTTYEVKQAFFDYQYLKDALDITKDNLELLKSLEQIAATRTSTGSTAANLIKLQMELGRMENKITSLRDMQSVMRARLNQATGAAGNHNPGWPEKSTPLKTDTQKLIDHYMQNNENPEISSLYCTLQANANSLKLSRKQTLPDFTLGLSYIDTAPSDIAGIKDSGKDPLIATIAINLPIWQESYTAKSSSEKSKMLATSQKLENLKNSINTKKQMAAFNAKDALRKNELYKNTLLPQARQNFEITRQAFRSGTTDFNDLIKSVQTILEFELESIKARAECRKYLAELEMLSPEEKTVRKTAQTNT